MWKCLDSYNAARTKLRQAEETSTLETDDEAGVGRCQRKKRLRRALSEDESSPEKKQPKTTPKTTKQVLLPLPAAPPAPRQLH